MLGVAYVLKMCVFLEKFYIEIRFPLCAGHGNCIKTVKLSQGPEILIT